MGRIAPRKQASTAHILSKQQGGKQDGDDSPSRQIAFEAAMGRGVSQEERTEHVQSAFTAHLDESQEKHARDKESTDILQRAAQKRRQASKLNSTATVERKSPRKRKAEQALYALLDSDEEEKEGAKEDGEDAAPATPMVTRLAARKTASTEQIRSASKTEATTKSPKEQQKPARWSKRDDERLSRHLQQGTGIDLVHEEFDSRTLPEVEERMAHLYELRQKERAEQEDEAAGQQDFGQGNEAAPVVEKGAPWSRQDVQFLLELWDANFTPDEILKRLPGRSWEAVQSRYYKANAARKNGKRIAPEKNESPPKRAKLKTTVRSEDIPLSAQLAAPKDSGKQSQPPLSASEPIRRRRGRPQKQTKTPEPAREPQSAVAESQTTRGRGITVTDPLQENHAAEVPAEAATESATRLTNNQRTSKKSKVTSLDPEPDTADGTSQVVDSVEDDGDYIEENDEGEDGAGDRKAKADRGDEEQHKDGNDEEEGEDEDEDDDEESVATEYQLWEAEGTDDKGNTKRVITIPADLDLWGQRDVLNKILQAAIDTEDISFEHDFKNRKKKKTEYDDVKAIRRSKEKLVALLRKVPSAVDFDVQRGKIDGALYELDTQLRNIDIGEFKEEADKYRFFKQLHVFVTIDIVSILKTALQAHAAIQAEDDEVKLWELNVLKTVAVAHVSLYNRARKWDHTFTGISAIRNGMLAPLKKVSEVFERAWKKAWQARDRATMHEEAIVTSQSRQERDDREQYLKRKYDEKYNRLRSLFLWRSAAASVRYPASTKFRMSFKNQAEWQADVRVEDDQEVELDSDGLPIERVPLFGHRRPGSRPPRLDRLSIADEGEEWTQRELVALVTVLRKLHGSEKLFKELIDRSCRAEGPLQHRTLPEILRKTAELVDVHARAVEQAGVDDVEEAEAKWPDFLREIPDLDLIELLW